MILEFPTEEFNTPVYEDEQGEKWFKYELVFPAPKHDGEMAEFAIEVWAVGLDHAQQLVKHLQSSEVEIHQVLHEEEVNSN